MSEQVPDKKNTEVALGDESRVKVLSPGMMVYKRFIRNKLAIIGIIIIAAMFLFCFLGGFLYPYEQEQVFKHQDYAPVPYASGLYNTQLRYTVDEDVNFSVMAQANFHLAVAENRLEYKTDNITYNIDWLGENAALVTAHAPLLEADIMGRRYIYSEASVADDVLRAAFEEANGAGLESLEYEGNTYNIQRERRFAALTGSVEYAVASRSVVDAYRPEFKEIIDTFDFRKSLETAFGSGLTSFEYNGAEYTIEMHDEVNATVYEPGGQLFANISNISVTEMPGLPPLSIEYKADARQAIIERKSTFESVDENGLPVQYTMSVKGINFEIRKEVVTELISTYLPPSSEHLLGTDRNGMDILARLMYGGRISITVGFVVVILELILGVVIGGISGYFSGWVDTAIMRFVDLFNTIPQFPLMIILASIMDAYRVDPMTRVYFLMALLGLLGWTGIARTVRGQILTLREQEFMVAAESMGLSVPRRIFKHLVPNVMPLLIVYATMGIGGIIISEATLSFLGLGIKYPMASWGSMVNSATDIFVLSNYPLTWMPAGLLIFITVLGFNFVGDGLRDAFDPKMKR